MTIRAQFDDPVQMLLETIDLEAPAARTGEEIFVGHSHEMPGGRVFGGQVLAQATVAAGLTVPEDQPAHSFHGYFLRAGDTERDITFGVDRIHDGRSFSRRRVQGYQDGVPIFSSIFSFQRPSDGVEHAATMPEVPAPETLPDPAADQPIHPASRRMLDASPIEVRHVEGHLMGAAPADAQPHQSVWVRLRRPIGSDRLLNQAALAYLSDNTIQEAPLRGAGLSWTAPGLNVASLDHAMWWHRPTVADDWMLYVQQSPGMQGARGLSIGNLFTRSGVLIATVAQEVLVRTPPA